VPCRLIGFDPIKIDANPVTIRVNGQDLGAIPNGTKRKKERIQSDEATESQSIAHSAPLVATKVFFFWKE